MTQNITHQAWKDCLLPSEIGAGSSDSYPTTTGWDYHSLVQLVNQESAIFHQREGLAGFEGQQRLH